MKVNVTLNLYIPAVDIRGKSINLDVDDNTTILDLVNLIDKANSGFKNNILVNGEEISNEFIIFINGNNVVSQEGLRTTLHCNDEVNVIPAIAGG